MGKICCQKKSDKLENNEIKVCQRDGKGGRLGGKIQRAVFHADSYSVQKKWDSLLPYVHLLQLATHVRKGLLKRGNNKKERDRELCVVCFSSPFGKKLPLSKHWEIFSLSTDSIRISGEMAEINALRSWPVLWGRPDLEERNQSSEEGVLVVISKYSQCQSLPSPSLLSNPHLEWKHTTVSSTSYQTHDVDKNKSIWKEVIDTGCIFDTYSM